MMPAVWETPSNSEGFSGTLKTPASDSLNGMWGIPFLFYERPQQGEQNQSLEHFVRDLLLGAFSL